jgi:hypothetical protein
MDSVATEPTAEKSLPEIKLVEGQRYQGVVKWFEGRCGIDHDFVDRSLFANCLERTPRTRTLTWKLAAAHFGVFAWSRGSCACGSFGLCPLCWCPSANLIV